MAAVTNLAGLAALRLALALAPTPDLEPYGHQLATPLTAFTRLKEGVYLYSNGINPYSGGPVRHSPITLLLFSTIFPTGALAPLFWALLDIVGAWCLTRVFRIRSGAIDASHERLIALFYLFNPYTFLCTTSLSTSTIDNTLYVATLYFACTKRASATMLSLALLTTSSLTSALFLPVLTMLLVASPKSGLTHPQPFSASFARTVPILLRYALYLLALVGISTLIVGDLSWVSRTWGATLTLPDVTPNPGLWWYFFTEMFDHFRPFFLMTFSMHLLIYVAPVCLKFQHDPLFAAFLLQGIFATFKAYPSLADPGLFINCVALFPEIFPHLSHPLVTTMLYFYSSSLLVLFHNLWLVQGTGNANFYYASTMVFGLANGFAILDCIKAGLRLAFGHIPDGYEVIQT